MRIWKLTPKGQDKKKEQAFGENLYQQSLMTWHAFLKAKQVCKREVVPSCFATCTLAQCPTTASNVQFDLLCCQPRPVPETLSTRTCHFTVSCPCGLPAWHGRAINTHDTDMHNLLHLPSFLQ